MRADAGGDRRPGGRARRRWQSRPGVTSPTPGTPVDAAGRHVATELVAVVGACLDNVAAPRRRGAPGLGAARGPPGRDRGGRCATRARASRTAGSRRRRPRAARRQRVDPRAGSATSAAPPTLTTGAFGTEWEFAGSAQATMTIHSGHPFADPEPDPVRRLRGRLGGAVTLWTTGDGRDPRRADGQLADGRRRRARAGAGPGRPRLRPSATRSRTTGGCVVQLLSWQRPRPGRGVRRHRARARRRVPHAEWEQTRTARG